MTSVEKILVLIEQHGITKNKLVNDIGLSKNTFGNWISRGTSPSGDDLAKIADYFHVSVDYLLNRETPSASSLSPDEQNLISHFRALNPAGQEYILTQVDYAMQQDKYKQEFSAAKDA
ncbi:MAG: helix-turn-helix transcriptional regulator [Oscillibacter sp.]|nr:helix-turn-helix transcriptional regulator [Oscillibacter sp.]MEA4993361.1 helix-turn-helix transcriptional regulator [Oscillibacter sp.]